MAQDRPVIRVVADAAAVAREAAGALQHAVAAAVAARGRAAVALSGGSTPRRLLALLADADQPYRAALPWHALHLFWGDERHVPPDHADSNYRMTREALLDSGLVPEANVHRVPAEDPDAGHAAGRYQAELAAFFAPAPGALPRFDVVLLGMGADGHTASLFPGTDALDETEKWVTATYVEKFSAHRITLSFPVINAARQVLFLVTGADKAETLAAVLEGARRPKELPSQSVRPAPGDLVWLVDGAAARGLTTS